MCVFPELQFQIVYSRKTIIRTFYLHLYVALYVYNYIRLGSFEEYISFQIGLFFSYFAIVLAFICIFIYYECLCIYFNRETWTVFTIRGRLKREKRARYHKPFIRRMIMYYGLLYCFIIA